MLVDLKERSSVVDSCVKDVQVVHRAYTDRTDTAAQDAVTYFGGRGSRHVRSMNAIRVAGIVRDAGQGRIVGRTRLPEGCLSLVIHWSQTKKACILPTNHYGPYSEELATAARDTLASLVLLYESEQAGILREARTRLTSSVNNLARPFLFPCPSSSSSGGSGGGRNRIGACGYRYFPRQGGAQQSVEGSCAP